MRKAQSSKKALFSCGELYQTPSTLCQLDISTFKGRSATAKQNRRRICRAAVILAEGGGFEPPVELPPHNLSKVAPSTTRTPLQSLFRPSARLGLPTAAPRSGAGLPAVASQEAEAGARSGTRTRTYSRIADFESAAAVITPPWLCPVWSGRRESNPRSQLGRLELCH